MQAAAPRSCCNKGHWLGMQGHVSAQLRLLLAIGQFRQSVQQRAGKQGTPWNIPPLGEYFKGPHLKQTALGESL